MSKRITYLSLAAGLMLPVAAFAAPLNYTYIDINYINQDFDGSGTDVDGDGFAINGSALFAENFFVQGRYADSSVDGSVGPFSVDLDFQRITVGVGYQFPVAEGTSLFGAINYEDIDLDVIDDDGYSVEGGLRYALMPSLEVNGGVEYVDVGDVVDGEFGFKLGGVYDFTQTIAGVVGYENVDDLDEWRVGVRFNF